MARGALIWLALLLAMALPVAAAAFSPLLAWRDTIYILAGFAGIIALALMLIQPLLAAEFLPGLLGTQSRRVHRWIGGSLVTAVIAHVAGLWVTSPPDVIDALTFTSPTPFSAWGVVAMWALFATALLAATRRRLRLRWRQWRVAHLTLGGVIVGGTIVHALLIEGTMEPVSKALLCIFVALATLAAVLGLRVARR